MVLKTVILSGRYLWDHAETTISPFEYFLQKNIAPDRNYYPTEITPRDPSKKRWKSNNRYTGMAGFDMNYDNFNALFASR